MGNDYCRCDVWEVCRICTPKDEYERIAKIRKDLLNKESKIDLVETDYYVRYEQADHALTYGE